MLPIVPSVGSAKGCNNVANDRTDTSALTTGVGMLTSASRLSSVPMNRELCSGLYAIGPPPKLKPCASGESPSGTRNAPTYSRLRACSSGNDEREALLAPYTGAIAMMIAMGPVARSFANCERFIDTPLQTCVVLENANAPGGLGAGRRQGRCHGPINELHRSQGDVR